MEMKRQKQEHDKATVTKPVGGQSTFHQLNIQEHAKNVLLNKNPPYKPNFVSTTTKNN